MRQDLPALRYDVVTNDWVLYSPARAQRPHEQSERSLARRQPPDECPFCPGREGLNPNEILRVDHGHGGDWSVRVIKNKFPAVQPDAVALRSDAGPVFTEMGGYGSHEVVVESPEHDRPLYEQPADQAERLLQVLQGRFDALRQDPLVQAVVLFKNHGERAGSTVHHPHWQVIALPVVPHMLRTKYAIALEHFDRRTRSLYSELLDEELRDGSRVVALNGSFAAVAPYASHMPYQVRILPRRQQASFGEASPGELKDLAAMLCQVLRRLDAVLGGPDFNLTVETAPLGTGAGRHFLWHINVLPRLSTQAGFEIGTGMAINPVRPEDAAAALRL